jgi:hypothetical protein
MDDCPTTVLQREACEIAVDNRWTKRELRRVALSVAMVLGLALLNFTAAGCAMPAGLHQHRAKSGTDAPTGSVTVSGPLAVSRSIPVDVDGMPLSDVVELALRPGFRSLGDASAAAMIPVQSGLSPATIDESFESWASETENDPDGLADLKAQYVQHISRRLSRTGERPGTVAEIRASIETEILQLQQQGAQLPPLTSAGASAEEKLSAIATFRESLVDLYGDWSEPAVQSVRTSPAVSDRAASVIVSQRSQRRLIVPLRTVTLTAAGDIRVLPGDHVTIAWSAQVPGAATATETAASGIANVAVSTISAAPETLELNGTNTSAGMTLASVFQTASSSMQFENSAMVSRVASDGVTEVHLFSTPLDTRLGSSEEAFEQLRDFRISDGDAVNFGVLELNPLVIQGRTITRLDGEMKSSGMHDRIENAAASATNGGFIGLKRWQKRSQLQFGRITRSMFR